MRYASSSLRAALAVIGVLLFASTATLTLSGCPKKKVKKAGCDSDKDCSKGTYCVNKKCQECRSNADCGEGKECNGGACVAKSECRVDADCSDGKVCKAGSCVACSSNDQCGPGGKCNAGKCNRAVKCKKDDDCADDQDCVNGTCQRPWKISTPVKNKCDLTTVYFAFDQSTIASEYRDGLNATAECIKKNKGRDVYVIGHTDQVGTEEYNIALSERRARTVSDYLARLGVDPARLRVIPKGESESTGNNKKDRRVVFEWR